MSGKSGPNVFVAHAQFYRRVDETQSSFTWGQFQVIFLAFSILVVHWLTLKYVIIYSAIISSKKFEIKSFFLKSNFFGEKQTFWTNKLYFLSCFSFESHVMLVKSHYKKKTNICKRKFPKIILHALLHSCFMRSFVSSIFFQKVVLQETNMSPFECRFAA